MTSEMRSVPVTTRPMDKNTLLRKSMRILRLLEVSETGGLQVWPGMRATVGAALRDDCPRLWDGRPLHWGMGAAEAEDSPGRTVASPALHSIRPNRTKTGR